MQKLSDLIKENDSKAKNKEIGLAEHFNRLSKDLEKAKENPVLKAVENLEQNRKTILDNLSKYDSQTLQEKMNKLKLDFSNPLVQSAIVNTQIADSIANSTRIKDLVDLQYSLKPEYLATQKAIESFQQTINNPTIQSSILEASKLSSYESEIDKITKSIANNQNLFESSKGLAALSAQIASDSLKHKLEEQRKFSVPEIVKRDYIPIEMPKNPMIKQNEEIISLLENLQEQNNTLIQFEKSDQEIQKSSIELTNKIQTNNEIMIQELKVQNQNLETQLSQKEVEIEQNKKDNSFTRKVAIWGIGISIVVGIASSIIPFYISYQEKLENDKDNEKLLEAVNNKTNENQNITMLLKEIQLQNEINKNIEENQIKLLIKATEFQNEYFKKKDKK
ncbi:hypothetical protein [Aliarcobacter butzleri]|uniref:hypothetical protein n=1 Tax=Aliarcobacter butzleri TaxID=28197 RepID=UPI002B24BCFE|nr:hypothetical protein [Aliarcobacter butzleri]